MGCLHMAGWSTSDPVELAGAPRASVPSQLDPGASDGLQAGSRLYSHLLQAPQGLLPRHQWVAPWNQIQNQTCSCNCDSMKPLGPCWRGPPVIYYGGRCLSEITAESVRVTDHVLHPTVRSSLGVGVEVVEVVEEVEEMAIQETLDVMSVFNFALMHL